MQLHVLHPTRNRIANAPNFALQIRQLDPVESGFIKEFGRVTLRPIRPDDEARMIKFHEGLSEESIYLRYFEHISLDTRTLHERLARVCTNSADSFAIIAEQHATSHHAAQIIAVGRLTTMDEPGVAGFAMLMADALEDTELPRDLFRRLIAVARAYGFQTMAGELLVADHDTLNLCRDNGFTLHTVPEDGIVKVTRAL